MKKTITYFFVFTVYALVAYASFWRVLTFTFSKDDWLVLWGSVYNIRAIDAYWIHPATIGEEFVFSHLFGSNPLPWMLFGFLLRVATAFAVFLFARELTNSKKTGFLSGLFFAGCYSGLEAIGFVSAHAGAIALFLLISSFYFFARFLRKEKKMLRYFLIFYFFGFLADPGRVLPALFLLPILSLFFGNTLSFSRIVKKKTSFLIVSVCILVAGFLFIFFVKGSLFSLFVERLFHNYLYLFQKLYLLGNYFAAIGNLLVGWIYPIAQDPQNTAFYNKIIARIGVLFVLFSIIHCGFFIKKKNTFIGFLTFFSLWISIFYLPNWLFEPRAPMAGSHRYLLFSGVGFCMLVAYCISFVKEKWLVGIAAVLFVVINMYTSNRILQYQQTYRSARVVDTLWSQVFQSVPKDNNQYIFVFSGQQPLLSQAVELGGNARFALQHGIVKESMFPLFIHDVPTLLSYLCRSDNPIPLQHVFAWKVFFPDTLHDDTVPERKLLTNEAWKKGCVLQ